MNLFRGVNINIIDVLKGIVNICPKGKIQICLGDQNNIQALLNFLLQSKSLARCRCSLSLDKHKAVWV